MMWRGGHGIVDRVHLCAAGEKGKAGWLDSAPRARDYATMWHSLLVVAGLLGLAVSMLVVCQIVMHLAVARAMERRDQACPFEDDDNQPLPRLAIVALSLEETGRLLRAIVTAPLGIGPSTGSSSGRVGRPVVLLVAAPLPLSAVRPLAATLAAHGRVVVGARLALRPDTNRAKGRLGSLLERAQRGHAALDVVAFGRAARPLLDLLTTPLATGVCAKRVLCIAGVLKGASWLDQVDVISIYSLDDPWVRPATAAYHPAALDIVMRAEGHLGLVGSERARAVAMEHLVGDAVQRTS